MHDTMTSRQRWLAALQQQSVDRFPFWPKIEASYFPAQHPSFHHLSVRELHEWIGSDQHEWVEQSAREVRTNTAREYKHEGNLQHCIFHTPHGSTTLVQQWDDVSQSWHPIMHPVYDLQTIRLMTDFYLDESWEFSAKQYASAQAWRREVGERALVGTAIGESPLMFFIEFLAGIENAHYLLLDYPQEVEALFSAMHASLLRKTEINAEHGAADVVYFMENTSTTLISPGQYRRYCLPYLRAYSEIMRSAGQRMILHMCGHLKQLLPDIATLPVTGYEAFTAPTLGNTTLLDGRTASPDVCLIGGTSAILWMRPVHEIIAQLAHDLDELPHHRGVVITSAGVMPPIATPETIKEVCDWVKEYPTRIS